MTTPSLAARVLDVLAREPVLLVGAVTAWVAATGPSELVMGAVVATGTYIARLLSKSTRTAGEDVEVARYVGLVEGQARTLPMDPEPTTGAPAAPATPPARRARRTP